MASRSLVEGYQCFGRTWCIHSDNKVPPKNQCFFTTLHITFLKTAIFRNTYKLTSNSLVIIYITCLNITKLSSLTLGNICTVRMVLTIKSYSKLQIFENKVLRIIKLPRENLHEWTGVSLITSHIISESTVSEVCN